MRIRRTFTKEFKKQVVENILSGVLTPAAACRQYNIAYPVISRWQKAYSLGQLDNEPSTEAGFQLKIEQLERMLGQLAMENNVLKKILKSTASGQQKNDSLLPTIYSFSKASKGGVKC